MHISDGEEVQDGENNATAPGKKKKKKKKKPAGAKSADGQQGRQQAVAVGIYCFFVCLFVKLQGELLL